MSPTLESLSSQLHIVLPFAVALVGGAGVRLFHAARGEVLAQLLLPTGILCGWAWLEGGLPWPAPAWRPLSVLPWLVLLAAVAGLVMDWLGLGRRGRIAGALVIAVIAAWASPGWPLPPEWWGLAAAGAAFAAMAAVLVRLETRAPVPQTAPVMLTAASLGLVGLAWIAGAPGHAALAAAVAAASAGHLLCGWLTGVRFGAAALLGGGIAFSGLAAASALAGPLPALPVALLTLVFFADGTAARLPAGKGLVRRALAPVLLALVCLLPLALAMVAGYLAANVDKV